MSRQTKCTAEQIKAAIKGSGGIKQTIANRLKIDRKTFDSYLETMPTVRQAFDDENELMLDVAESVVYTNVQYAAKTQREEQVPVDAADAKWLLARKGRKRGYGENVELTGADGGPLTLTIVERIIDASPHADN